MRRTPQRAHKGGPGKILRTSCTPCNRLLAVCGAQGAPTNVPVNPFKIIKESAEPRFPGPAKSNSLEKMGSICKPITTNHLQSPPITPQSPLKLATNHLPITFNHQRKCGPSVGQSPQITSNHPPITSEVGLQSPTNHLLLSACTQVHLWHVHRYICGTERCTYHCPP